VGTFHEIGQLGGRFGPERRPVWRGKRIRAGLVAKAEDWLWSSLRERTLVPTDGFVHPGPVRLPEGWVERVNESQTEGELEQLRASVNRGVPYGSETWIERIAPLLGLEFTLRPRGRPRRSQKRRMSPFLLFRNSNKQQEKKISNNQSLTPFLQELTDHAFPNQK
jgi:hypothetical protein